METKIIKICKNSHIEDIDEKGIVTVAANAFDNEDADGDVSVYGSYTKTINENFSRVRWFLNHDKTILLGVPIEAAQTPKYLQVRGQLNLKKQIAKDIYEDYQLYAQYGKSLEHSVMVQAVKRDPTDRRKVLEWKWWEYSTLTNWGANSDTPLLGIKSDKEAANMNDTINWLELALKKANYTDERAKQMENHLVQLRSLINVESAGATLQNKPNEETINILNHFKNLFKL